FSQFLPVKAGAFAFAWDRIGIDYDQLVSKDPVLCSASPALVILYDVLVRRLEVDNVVPEPKHGPENGIVEETEVSRPINVVDQLLGGDQEKMPFAKIGSSIPTALRQLPSRQFKTFHLDQYCRSPGVQAFNG